MAGKELLPLIWIPRPPHIWITFVLSSLGLAFLTDWERHVKMCLKRPQCGRQPKKFSHIDTKAARYMMVLGEKWWSCAPKKFKKPRKKGWGGKENPRSTWGGEENAHTLLWMRFGLALREPRRFLGNQSPFNQIIDVVLTNRRSNPVALDPTAQQAGPR